MRKRKISVVLLLILLVVLTSVFVACNPTGTANPNPEPTPIPTPGPDNPDLNGGTPIDSRLAWNMLKNAAFAAVSQESDSRYINVDTSFILGYAKDGSENVFVMRVAVAMNLAPQSTKAQVQDQFLVELRQFGASEIKDAQDNEAINNLVKNDGGELLAGFYFYEGKLVADVRGIKNAAGETGESVHVVWTDNLDIANFAKKLHGVFKQLNITDLLFNELLGYNIGDLIDSIINADLGILDMTVEDLIVTLLFSGSFSSIKDNGNGSQTLLIPCDLSFVASLLPLLQGLISEDIIGLVNKVLGLDLGKLGALTGMAIYIQADIQDGVLDGVDTSIDVNFNSNASEAVKDRYGDFQSSVGIKLGYIDAKFVGAPTLDVVGILKNRIYDKKQNISFYDHIAQSTNKYSILTFEGDVTLSIDTSKQTVSISNVMDSFGTLFTNILKTNLGEDMYKALLPLFAMDLNFDKTENSIAVKIRAEINTKDASKTRIALELRGSEGATRLGVYYTGRDEAVYIDASGVLGNKNTKLKVEDINVNELLDGLMDKLFDTIIKAVNGNTNTEEQYNKLAANGAIIKQHTGMVAAEDDSNEIGDTMGLIMAIVDNITVGMDGNIFNINTIHLDIAQNILDYIFGLIFVGDLEGGKVPVTNATLTYKDLGFGKDKSLSIAVDLGKSEQNPLVKLGAGVKLKFGTISDPSGFADLFENIYSEHYLPITKDGALNAEILHVNLQTGLDINIEALSGELAQLQVNLKDLALGDTTFDVLLDILFKLGSIRGGLVADIQADIDLTSGFNEAALLKSTAKIKLLPKDASGNIDYNNEVLAIYLQEGKLYINAQMLCIGVDKIMIDLQRLSMMGVEMDAPSADDEALATADGTADEDITQATSTDRIIALIGGMIQGINLGKNSIEIAFVSNLLQALIDGLNIDGIDIIVNDAGVEGGIKIELVDGLNLSELKLGIYMSIGDHVNFEIGLNGFEAGLGESNTNYLDLETQYSKDDFVDLFANPFVSFDGVFGLNLSVEQGTTTIDFGRKGTHWLDGDGITYKSIEQYPVPSGYKGLLYYFDDEADKFMPAFSDTISVGFDQKGTFEYKLKMSGRLDLASVMSYLLGDENVDTQNRRSELLIELTGKKFSEPEKVLLGLYYTGKRL